MQRKIRVLVGKPGLDGHDRGAKVVAAALRDAGMEVIYTGLHQTPEQIVEAALQEDADVVALSILSGAHMTLFEDILRLMKERGLTGKLLTGGGIIPPEDMETLAKLGVGRLFGPGASTQEIAEYIRAWFVAEHGAQSLAPMVRREASAPSAPRREPAAPSAPRRRPAAPSAPRRKPSTARVASARSGSGGRSGTKSRAGSTARASRASSPRTRARTATPKRTGSSRPRSKTAKRKRPSLRRA